MFLVLTIVTFVHVILRAFMVPITQDEVLSFWRYVDTGRFLPFCSYLDAGNHHLSSFTGVVAHALSGPSLPALRAGSVLAFVLYAWGAWLLAREARRALVRWCLLLALLWCPYLLDYFSMFRGYGPAMACWIWALWGLLRYVVVGTMRSFILMSVALFLGVFSDLSLLPFWPMFLVLAWALRPWSAGAGVARLAAPIAATVLQLAGIVVAATVALRLNETGLLYHGSGTGYYPVTVASLVNVIFGSDHPVLPAIVTALVLLAVLVAISDALHDRDLRSAPLLLALLLLGDVAARKTIHLVFGTNFPLNRAALQLAPLCILLFGYVIDRVGTSRPALSLVALCLLALPIQRLCTLNLDRVNYDLMLPVPSSFMDRVWALQHDRGRPVVMSAMGQLPEVWAFEALSRTMPIIPLRSEHISDDPDDVRIIMASRPYQVPEGYHVVDRSAVGDILLMLRDKPLRLELLVEYPQPDFEGTEEFLGIPLPPEITEGRLFIRLDGRITTEHPGEEALFVTEVRDGSGHTARYTSTALRFTSLLRHDGELDAMFLLPTGAGGQRLAYLYNPAKKLVRTKDLRVRLYTEVME